MITLEDRCQNYSNTFPTWPPPTVGIDGRISGTWILGQNYKSKQKYYGEYPPNYLKRVMALFPDIVEHSKILHLFSGVVTEPGVKFDINSDLNPDIVGDAHQLASYFPTNHFQLILADPDYTEEDAAHHGNPLINRNKVVKECVKILKPTGFLCWLDQIWPMFSKRELTLIGVIGIIRSTNHRVRALFIFQKLNGDLSMRKCKLCGKKLEKKGFRHIGGGDYLCNKPCYRLVHKFHWKKAYELISRRKRGLEIFISQI